MTDEPFRFDEERGDGVLRLRAAGEIDMAAEEHLVEAVSASLGNCAGAPLVLDLTAVTFMDSSGLRAVLRGRRAAEERGVPFRLALAEGPVTRLLRLAGVADRFGYE